MATVQLAMLAGIDRSITSSDQFGADMSPPGVFIQLLPSRNYRSDHSHRMGTVFR